MPGPASAVAARALDPDLPDIPAQRKPDEAERELEDALRVAREMGNPAQLRMTLVALASLRQAQARPDDVAVANQEALAIVEQVASSVSDPALRQTLLGSREVTRLQEAVHLD